MLKRAGLLPCTLPLLVALIVSALLCGCMLFGTTNKESANLHDLLLSMPALYPQSGSSDKLLCARQTNLDLAPDRQYPGYKTTVTELYTLENAGEEPMSGLLVFPYLSGCQSGDFSLQANGSACTTFYGASTLQTVQLAHRDGKVVEKLYAGDYFSAAFPAWPALPDSSAPDKDYGVKFYLVPFTLQPGESWILTAVYDEFSVASLRFCSVPDALPCQSHTLSVKNADCCEVAAQNFVAEWLREPAWDAQLDPDFLNVACYDLVFTY